MYRITHGTTHNLPDTPAFIETLNQLEESPVAEARRLFDPKREIVVARAPGRLDVMGGIADYSGSLVLELPLQEATYAALQRDPSRRLRIVSLAEDSALALAFEMPLADFEGAGDPVDYEAARARFERDPARHWAAYVAGVFLVLMRERELPAVAVLSLPRNVAQDPGSTAGGIEQAGEHFQRRGFARPVRAEKTDQFAFLDCEIDVLDRDGHFILAVEQSPNGASQSRFLLVSAK